MGRCSGIDRYRMNSAVTREILYVRGYLGGGLNLDLRIYDLVLDFLQER